MLVVHFYYFIREHQGTKFTIFFNSYQQIASTFAAQGLKAKTKALMKIKPASANKLLTLAVRVR